MFTQLINFVSYKVPRHFLDIPMHTIWREISVKTKLLTSRN